MILQEKTRAQVLDASKNADNYVPSNQALGKNRYFRRRHSSVSHSVKDYNKINMNDFIKKDILTFNIDVRGETSNYKVNIKLNDVLRELKRILKSTGKEVEFKNVSQAITRAFDTDNIYFHCECPDWKYRMQHWAVQKGIASDLNDPGPGKGIANPNDTKGDGCKHVQLVLANKGWLFQLASAINNYFIYMKDNQERLYQTIIFPALYDKKYSDEIQQQLFNPDTMGPADDELNSDEDTFNKANQYNKEKNLFKKGNQKGIRWIKNNDGEDEIDLGLENGEQPEEGDNTKEI